MGSRAASQGLVSLLIQKGTSMRALQQCKQSCVPSLVDTNSLCALSKNLPADPGSVSEMNDEGQGLAKCKHYRLR